jgi:D-alanyl-D-alanine carboxypeptidase
MDAGPRLQALLDGLVSRKRIGHAVLGVASGDGSMRWLGAAGEARPGVPMRPETPWFIASVTKLFIAVSVLQLHESGDVDLDASIVRYLPPETVAGLHRTNGTDATESITVRHLLSHTSGLRDYLESRPKGGRSLYTRLARGEDMAWGFDEVVRITRDELQPYFPPQDLTAERQKARYSDTNYQLLIAIVEAVTGQRFHEVLQKRIFSPLGMRHTYLPGRSEHAEPAEPPPALYAKGGPLDVPRAMGSFNDLVGTSDDMLRFGQALVRGEVFDDPATFALMTERWNRVFSTIRYGLGMMRFRIPALFGPGRRGVTLLGHSGATGSWLFHCPEMDLFVTGTVDEIRARALPFRFVPRVLRALAR